MFKKYLKTIIRKLLTWVILFAYKFSSKEVFAKIFLDIENYNIQKRYMEYRKIYKIAPTFKFNGPNILFYENGQIICGEHSYIGNLSTIEAFEGCRVKIGNHVQISHNVRIYTHTCASDQDFSEANREYFNGDVSIEDYVWIGANVFINPGITIGTNSIIGANAVVTKDVPPFAIAVGVPARIIKYKSMKDE